MQVYTASNGSFWLWTQKIRKQPHYSGAALELSIKSHDHHQIMDFRGVPHWLSINLHEDQLLVTHRLKKKIEAAEVKISWIFSPSVSPNPRVPWSNLIASFMKPSLLGKHTHLSNSTSLLVQALSFFCLQAYDEMTLMTSQWEGYQLSLS